MELKITEGVAGMWFYHLSEVKPGQTSTKALCGARIMPTNIPLTAWGVKTEHLNERYCGTCEVMSVERQPARS